MSVKGAEASRMRRVTTVLVYLAHARAIAGPILTRAIAGPLLACAVARRKAHGPGYREHESGRRRRVGVLYRNVYVLYWIALVLCVLAGWA